MTGSKQNYAGLWDIALNLCDVADDIALSYFRRTNQGVQNKDAEGFDPVTRADREIESAMRDILARVRPDDGIIGEEFGTVSGQSGLNWVLDPIDGTRGFISGTPCWGVLVAVCDETGAPILGVIDQPYIGERFCGGLGRAEVVHREAIMGAVRELAVRECRDLRDAVLFSTFPEIGTEAERAAFGRVAGQCQLVRYGLDCYAYALLAAGQIDLVIEAGLNAYDICAPIALVQASGGIITDWQGGEYIGGGHNGQIIAAGDRRVYEAALLTIGG